MPITARHVDAYELRSPEETDEGYLRLEGVVATPGIMPYFRGGKVVREYVPAETLRDPQFLESLEGKPVTIEHPEGKHVGPSNHRRLSVGTVLNVRWQDNIADWHYENCGVVAELIIRDPRGIEAFRGEGRYSGQPKRQLSPAYDVTLREQDGVNQYGRFDAIQIDRRAGNHVALTASGRDGQQSAVRADSFVAIQSMIGNPFQRVADTDEISHADSSNDTDVPQNEPAGDPDMDTVKYHLDGMGIVDLPEESVEVVKQWHQDQMEELGEVKHKIQPMRVEKERLEAQLEELKKAAGGQAEMDDDSGDYEAGMGNGEYTDGPGQGGEAVDEYMDGGPGQREDSSDDGGEGVPDRYDSFEDWYDDLRGVEKTADQLRMDSDDLPSNPIDAKRHVLNEWRDEDGFADDMDPDRVDAKYEIVAELIDDQVERRQDSERQINQRAAAAGGRRGDTADGPSGRQAYLDKVYGRG